MAIIKGKLVKEKQAVTIGAECSLEDYVRAQEGQSIGPSESVSWFADSTDTIEVKARGGKWYPIDTFSIRFFAEEDE